MASDYFLKIDGIDGASIQKGHEKWIEIQSFSWGMSQTSSHGAGGGGGTGKVSVQDFHFVAHTGVQSPPLLVATGTGEHFKKAVLSVSDASTSADGVKGAAIKIELENVLVSSYQFGGTQGSDDGRPADQFSLNFTKIEMLVADASGASVRGGWDVAANKKV